MNRVNREEEMYITIWYVFQQRVHKQDNNVPRLKTERQDVSLTTVNIDVSIVTLKVFDVERNPE